MYGFIERTNRQNDTDADVRYTHSTPVGVNNREAKISKLFFRFFLKAFVLAIRSLAISAERAFDADELANENDLLPTFSKKLVQTLSPVSITRLDGPSCNSGR